MINLTKSVTPEIRATDYDVFVIGGGINGAGVARDAAGRGLRVMLSEKRDYGAETSSATSKLIHGGLRYLEHYEFDLVWESLREREILMATAPHLIHPLRFLVPVYEGAPRAAWFMRLGLWLYDLLARSKRLPRSGAMGADERAAIPHLRQEGLTAVLHYPDCQVDDARLVLSVLMDARERGAKVTNYQEVREISALQDGYRITLRDSSGVRDVTTRYVVNTAGPFANTVLDHCPGDLPRHRLRLVRGSHILLPMPEPAFDSAFTVQMPDNRVVFVIPWLRGPYLMVGTTDTPHLGDPHDAKCSDEERDYLLAAYNDHFGKGGEFAAPIDIIWSWAGVRPLVDDQSKDPSKITRDVKIVSHANGRGGFVTVYGGKLTTHRSLADKVMKRLAAMGCEMSGPWTATAPVYGGALSWDQLEELAESGPQSLGVAIRRRLVTSYGSIAKEIFEAIRIDPALATEVTPGVPVAELIHARSVEDVIEADDFLCRRSRLFLELDDKGRAAVRNWFGG